MDVDALVNALQVAPPHASRNLLSEVRQTFAGELTLHTGLGSREDGHTGSGTLHAHCLQRLLRTMIVLNP
jgi:hypothetical protein